MQETRQKSLKQLLRLMCEVPLFIYLFNRHAFNAKKD